MRLRTAVLAILGATAGGATVASAAALGTVTAQPVTVYTGSSTVPTQTCTSNPTQDATVDFQHKNWMLGGNATLDVSANGGKSSDGFVQFAPCASANAHVVSATLTATMASAPGATRTWGLYPIQGAWSESTVSASTAPAVSGTASTSATTVTTGATMSWSVTGDVQGWVDGGTNNGWSIQDTATTSASGSLASRESGTPPVLQIVYYP